MSHFAIRVGHFFHYHPFAHAPSKSVATPARERPCIVPGRQPSDSRDLAFLSLCLETKQNDRRAEMDRLSLSNRDDERSGGLDETVLFLL
jgi:hypothetical protein